MRQKAIIYYQPPQDGRFVKCVSFYVSTRVWSEDASLRSWIDNNLGEALITHRDWLGNATQIGYGRSSA